MKGGGPADSAQTLRENCFRYQPSKTHNLRYREGEFDEDGGMERGGEMMLETAKQEAFPHLVLPTSSARA